MTTARRAGRGGGERRARRWPLSARISLLLAVIVAIALVLMAAAASVAMRSWMIREVDITLAQNLHRAEEGVRRNPGMELTQLEGGKKPLNGDGMQSQQSQNVAQPAQPLDQQTQAQANARATDADDADDADDDSTVSSQGTDSDVDTDSGTDSDTDKDDLEDLTESKLKKDGPPGLRGPGSNEGQLQLISRDGETAAGLVQNFEVVTLGEAEIATLLEVDDDGRPENVTVGSYGTFRVRSETTEDGVRVIVGQSLSQINGITRTLLLVEGGLALLIIAAAAAVGRVWVVREMRPLGEVAQTARQISARDLQTTRDIEPFERVPKESAPEGTEVGDVGQALNAMIDNVEGALRARSESEQRLRQFVADASHELRTPLASIQGYTQLLQRDSIDAPTALSRISSESARMSGLVEDLLLLARLDAGRELATDPVDLVPLVVDAVMDAHAAGPSHKWVLEVPEGEDATRCVVAGDESALRQVLANLINNARIHTPDGTEVRVGVRVQGLRDDDLRISTKGERTWRQGVGPGGSVVLTVADAGPGIPAELRPTVFDRFVRGDTSRTRLGGKGSSGLGLSIVSSIAEALAGRVELQTQCEGEDGPRSGTGTTFEVILPRLV